jgi:hypothetical protein
MGGSTDHFRAAPPPPPFPTSLGGQVRISVLLWNFFF